MLGSAFHGGLAFVVMDIPPGRFLLSLMDAALAMERTLSPGFAAYVAAEVADALDHAHRAVGPMRIHLDDNGHVQLTNFGAAYSELLGRIRTPPGLLRGDPAYMKLSSYTVADSSPGSAVRATRSCGAGGGASDS